MPSCMDGSGTWSPARQPRTFSPPTTLTNTCWLYSWQLGTNWARTLKGRQGQLVRMAVGRVWARTLQAGEVGQNGSRQGVGQDAEGQAGAVGQKGSR